MAASSEFTKEQQLAYDLIRDYKNIFLTGPGGAGKSYFIEELKRRYNTELPEFKIGITALTGCAAILLGGGAKTLHSWSGIGLGRGSVGEIVLSIRRNRKALKNWMTTNLLIIDEISMLSAELFDKLNQIAKVIRRSTAPFGGMQVLLVGDFYQLPPIMNGLPDGAPTFAFESVSWNEVVNAVVALKTMHRQTDDCFRELLGRARIGKLNEADISLLSGRRGLPWKELEIKPTLLFSRRAMVDKINAMNLAALGGETITWKAKTVLTSSGSMPPEYEAIIASYDKDAPYNEVLELRNKAQVMLITNIDIDSGLVNGSRGVIIGFDTKGAEPLPIVQFKNGRREIIERNSWEIDDLKGVSRSQIPLRLAYAITIHKCQGATLDCALIDIGRSTFEYGQAYVALSRVKNLESLYVHEFAAEAVRASPQVCAFYEATNSKSKLE